MRSVTSLVDFSIDASFASASPSSASLPDASPCATTRSQVAVMAKEVDPRPFLRNTTE